MRNMRSKAAALAGAAALAVSITGAASSATPIAASTPSCPKHFCNWVDANYQTAGLGDNGYENYANDYIALWGPANDAFSSTFNNYYNAETFYENSDRTGRYITFASGKKVPDLTSYSSQLHFGETWNDRFSADA